jgi:hypothetical protein
MPVSIETKQGDTRSGTDSTGKPWTVAMPFDYGYLLGTVGSDGQHVDCFIGPDQKAAFVYVIHQGKEHDTTQYDEDKVMLGFSSANAALKAYKSAYVGVDLYQGMSVIALEAFKKKVYATKDKKRNSKIHAGGPGSGRHKGGIHPNVPPGKAHECQTNSSRVFKQLGYKVVIGDLLEKGWRGSDKSFTGHNHAWNITPDNKIYDSTLGSKEAENNNYYPRKTLDNKTSRSGIAIDRSFYAQYDGDYYQFTEKTGMQPIPTNHPPSLKNPIKVPVDNPDDGEDKYKDKKKRRSKRNLKDIKELARHQTGKPELAQTTSFVPMDMG